MVKEPFSWCIQFLTDVFDHPMFRVHAHLAIVLPTALVSHFAAVIFPSDLVMVTAPMMAVHRMDKSSRWALPIFGALF